MMKSKMTNLVLASLLSISFGSAFAASATPSAGSTSHGTTTQQGGGAMPPGSHPSVPSGSTKAEAPKAETGGRPSDSGAGKTSDGGTTGGAAGKNSDPAKTGGKSTATEQN